MEEFYIDNQTREDLELFGAGRNGVFECLNFTITNGGDKTLRTLLLKPLTNIEALKQSNDIIRFLMGNVDHLAFDKTSVAFMDYYLHRPDKPGLFSVYRALKNSIKHFIFPSQEYYTKRRGVHETLETLAFIRQFCNEFSGDNSISLISNLRSAVAKFAAFSVLAKIICGKSTWLNRFDVEKVDYLLRTKLYKEVLQLVNDIYALDAYYSVAVASRKMGFTLPVYLTNNEDKIIFEDIFHPFLEKPVPNSISLSRENSLFFITGANMSGKSTLMKSVGIAIYLAHLGFPVPAGKMETRILDGLITTINLADDISQGHSHFYNEVKRVKIVGEKLKEHKCILVMFDEFFRGTNIKDAYEASSRIILAFSKIKASFFIVSTHIVEVAHALKANKDICFRYFRTDMLSGKPVFDYRLLNGITDDRIGLWILENEGVFGLLEGPSTNNNLEVK